MPDCNWIFDSYKTHRNFFDTTVKNFMGNAQTVPIENIFNEKEGNVFNGLKANLNDHGKNIFHQIAAMDGDDKTFSQNELTLLLLLLDGEVIENNNQGEEIGAISNFVDVFDGQIDIKQNNKINSVRKAYIPTYYELIKNNDDITNGRNTEITLEDSIDGTRQVQPNCWLLAEIGAYYDTDFGKEIINNAVIDNKDGTYTVEMKGDGKSYTFTKQEILDEKASLSRSVGSDKVLIIEMAFQRLLAEERVESLVIDNKIPNSAIKVDNEGNYCYLDKDIFKYNKLDLKEEELKDKTPEERVNIIKNAIYEDLVKSKMGCNDIYYDIFEHLSGKNYIEILNEGDKISHDKKKIKEALKTKAKNKDNVAILFGNTYLIYPDNVEHVNGGHVNYVKDVKLKPNGKIDKVGVLNPHDFSQTVYLSLKDFLKYSKHNLGSSTFDVPYQFTFATNDEAIFNKLKLDE